MVTDHRHRVAFVQALVAAAGSDTSRVRIVVTMRADFFDQPLLFHELGELVRAGLVTVSFPADDELVAAITEPAIAAGLVVEPGLASEIVRDVHDQPGGLPLLQHALSELVARRDGDGITTAAYRASGGVIGALGRSAEHQFLSLDVRHQEAAEQLFLRLVTLDERRTGVRRRVRFSELTSLGVDPATTEEVLRRFGEARLLTFDRDPVTRGPTVEVAHEALFAAWDRLAAWIDTRREDLRQRGRLAAAADEWVESADDSFLLGGARLDQLGLWVDSTTLRLSDTERSFVAASRDRDVAERRARRRRRRVIVGGLVVVAMVSGVLAAVARLQQQRADRAATVAEAELQRAEASRLATRSGQQLTNSLDVALLLAVAAHRSDPSTETASALWNALAATVPPGPTAHGVLEGFLFPDVASLRSVAVNANGSRAVFAGASGGSGRIVVTDVGSRETLASLETGADADRADDARG